MYLDAKRRYMNTLPFLLPSVGREMSTSQSAVIPCGWGVKAVKAGWLIPLANNRVGGRYVWKLCDFSLTRAIAERVTDESLMIKRYTSLR